MKAKKILVVLTNHDTLGDSGKPTGYWLSEVSHFYDVVARAGYEVDFISPKGGKAPLDPVSVKLNDPVNREFMENPQLMARLDTTLSPDEVHLENYAAIYYVGGHGPIWDVATDEKIAAIASGIYENNGIVSAVCHGAAGLLNVKDSNGELLLKGRKVTGFSNLEETLVRKSKWVPYQLESELKERGAQYTKAALPGVSHVEVTGRIVTGQNPRSAKAVAEEVVKLLKQSR
jgi:putative intracellular protease/amidase